MPQTIRLSVASIKQVAQSLSQREDEDFILIYRDTTTDDWVIELNSNLDGLLVARLLNDFQGQMLNLMMQQVAQESNQQVGQLASAQATA